MIGAETARWRVETVSGTASEVHQATPPDDGVPTVWVVEATDHALVLGSAQDETAVDRDAASAMGIGVVRRRSGGGAVLVRPGGVVWIDVIVPRRDPLWDDDVGRAPLWVGRVWSEALEGLGHRATVHRGPMPPDDLARVVCFVGRAPGEVLIGARKVVGVSQRRTRDTARFQTAALLEWDADSLVALFPTLDSVARERIRATATALPCRGDELVAAFIEALIRTT